MSSATGDVVRTKSTFDNEQTIKPCLEHSQKPILVQSRSQILELDFKRRFQASTLTRKILCLYLGAASAMYRPTSRNPKTPATTKAVAIEGDGGYFSRTWGP
jgi:hypothetical protein